MFLDDSGMSKMASNFVLLPVSNNLLNTVLCRYNAVNFVANHHNRHPIARPWGRGMGCLLWFWSLIFILLLSLWFRWWCRDKLDRVITALDCICDFLCWVKCMFSTLITFCHFLYSATTNYVQTLTLMIPHCHKEMRKCVTILNRSSLVFYDASQAYFETNSPPKWMFNKYGNAVLL